MTTDTLGKHLLTLARQAITSRFDNTPAPSIDDPALKNPGATFVTLTQKGQLRGCIGSLEAWRPLATDVCENARAAAFSDPRFAPLSEKELAHTRIEVSLLTPPEAINFNDETDALYQLQPGVDGVILEYGTHRATFLPQVWEQLETPEQFIAQLKRKAGLPADFWSTAIRLSRYRVEKWKEHETGNGGAD